MDKDLLYNKSGVKDTTAYRAITNLYREDKEIMSVSIEITKGEVWEVETQNSMYTRYAIVLNCFERYAAVVLLQEQKPESNAVEVKAREIMYADAGRLGYLFYDKMIDFVRKLSEKEKKALQKAIVTALDLQGVEKPVSAEGVEIDNKELNELREALAQSEAERERLSKQMEGTQQPVMAVSIEEYYAIREELAAERREAQIYKRIYEDMLMKATGVR